MNNIKLSIILVNWNCGKVIIDCVESITKNILPLQYEVIVVDNNSIDGSNEEIEKKFPFVKFIKNKYNNLFAGANNQGYDLSKGEYVWILNSDTVLFDDSVRKMISFLENNSGFGAVTTKLLNSDKTTQYYMHRRFPTFLRICFALLHKRFPSFKPKIVKDYLYLDNDFTKNFSVEQAAGTSILIRREIIEKIGGLFDAKKFPLFFNDVDLCYRLYKYHYKIMCLCDSSIFHLKGHSTNKLNFFNGKMQYIPSSLAFFKKHGKYIDYLLAKLSYFLLFSFLILVSVFKLLIRKINLKTFKHQLLIIPLIIRS